jgi:UDP-N-acetylglucosamine--N-acetylmuramyl-(pentapeptide) pyrophosphoryl-undecaprenol N-acetylglucosamine transferase
MTPKALIMAGGTGGHIFPGLALAQALMGLGWQVDWLGVQEPSMESEIVPKQHIPFHAVSFKGVRAKGWRTQLGLPMALMTAIVQSMKVILSLRPQVVIGFGGYVSAPGGVASWLCRRPLVLHEQNSVAGMANRYLAHLTPSVFCAFPNALDKGRWIGNPLREAFKNQAFPESRYAAFHGPLRVLVVGGSLGAQALNELVPQALALMSLEARPEVTHQSGAKQMDALKARYAELGLSERVHLTPFIEDMASAMAQADLVISRAGASTVTEIAAVGVASLLVPYPHAVDDHQTHNAAFLSNAGGAWLFAQGQLSPQRLAQLLGSVTRPALLEMAQKAHALRQTQAVDVMVQACQQIVGVAA